MSSQTKSILTAFTGSSIGVAIGRELSKNDHKTAIIALSIALILLLFRIILTDR